MSSIHPWCIFTSNLTIDAFRNDLPDQAKQDALQGREGQRPTRNVLLAHEERWIKHFPDDRSYDSAIQYLRWRQSVARDMQLIVDMRRFRHLCYELTNFRNHVTSPDHGDTREGKKAPASRKQLRARARLMAPRLHPM